MGDFCWGMGNGEWGMENREWGLGARLTVISSAAGQPPIGKPLIGQARGRIRLIWRLYAESPQSREISLRNGTNRIVTGDLGALSLNRARYFFFHIDMQLRSR